MSKTKTQLNSDIATYFPSQSSGAISAADLRLISTGIVDSLVNYNAQGYVKIDTVASTGSVTLETGVLIWSSGQNAIFFWTGTGMRAIAFV